MRYSHLVLSKQYLARVGKDLKFKDKFLKKWNVNVNKRQSQYLMRWPSWILLANLLMLEGFRKDLCSTCQKTTYFKYLNTCENEDYPILPMTFTLNSVCLWHNVKDVMWIWPGHAQCFFVRAFWKSDYWAKQKNKTPKLNKIE